MKILALSFSPREEGNTEIMLCEALLGAQTEGAEIEFYSVAGKNIQPCDGCAACFRTGQCHIQDDMQALYDKMLAADGIIFGTPIHFYYMTSQARAVIDRTIALNHPDRNLSNKVGGIIVVGSNLGLSNALKDLYFYIIVRRMLPANFVAAYGGPKGDVHKLEKGKKAARDLGRQMVKLVEKKFEYPPEFPQSLFAYGTHTF